MRLGSIMLTLLLFAVLGSSVSAITWDAIGDFSITNGNPNGAWTYGTEPLGFGTFITYLFGDNTPAGNPGWYGWSGHEGHPPEVWYNAQSGNVYGVPPGYLSLHPAPDTAPSIIRWTAPAGVSGEASIIGQFLPGDGAAMQIAVLINNSIAWQATDSGSFNLKTNVNPGDTIDFAVYGGYAFGNTGLTAQITAVPEPSSIIALLGGLTGLVGLRRRRA